MLKLRIPKRQVEPRSSEDEGRPVLEIQFHPNDIRRRVRYLFLDRRKLIWVGVSAFTLLCFLALNLFLFPGVVSDLISRSRYGALVSERARHGQKLEALTQQLAELKERSDELHVRVSRMHITYGLEGDGAVGQGYPFPDREVPESIYANAIRSTSSLEIEIAEQMGVLETFIQEVRSFEEAHGEQVRMTPSTSPMRSSDFVLTSPFGTRRSPFTKQLDFHPGLDLAAQVGSEIFAPADGVVVFSGRYPLKQSVRWWRYGNLIAIRHGDRFISLYGHCEEISVRNGQKVRQGDLIGTVGNTGWSTNPHLHYEVRRADETGEFKPVDPRIYILDHQWRDQEQLLVRGRRAPDYGEYEPLPRVIGR